jgi:hypothetical protein
LIALTELLKLLNGSKFRWFRVNTIVYYESRKRELKRRLINEGRCDERLKKLKLGMKPKKEKKRPKGALEPKIRMTRGENNIHRRKQEDVHGISFQF